MVCGRCGTENKKESRFCRQCGNAMSLLQTVSDNMIGSKSLDVLLQNRYQLVDLIGRGGMGAVYLALDHRFSNRVCVVKEMLDQAGGQDRETAIRRFMHEADLLAALNHQGIPFVVDRFYESNRHYLVMEFVSGLDLKNLLDQYQSEHHELPPEEDVREYLYQLTDILVYLHHRPSPIYHRDIKLANILLNADGRVKLVDFGIARSLQSGQKGTQIGTQGYAPPEQYKGLVDHRSDIYSLGATMHHLLTGRDPQNELPFEFPPVRTLNPTVSLELDEIIQWMLAMNPSERPQDTLEIRSAILDISPGIEQQIIQRASKNRKSGQLIQRHCQKARRMHNGQKLCPNCLTCNREQSKFCKECGTPLI